MKLWNYKYIYINDIYICIYVILLYFHSVYAVENKFINKSIIKLSYS